MASTNVLHIIIPGVPVARERPRFSKFGTYDKQGSVKEFYRLSILNQLPKGFNVLTGPISLILLFELPIPKHTSKKKTLTLIGTPHVKKPDIDNLYKMLDAYNGVLWMDDSQIHTVTMRKMYSENPKTNLIVEYEGDTRE
jgi:Holliday junction resolvase RusA-like endonuclease